MENDSNQNNAGSLDDVFGQPIFTYTRAQALADGFQVEIPVATSREAGIRFPVYMTRTAWDKYVEVPAGVEGQDIQGRLWDVLWMMTCAMRRSTGAEMLFQLYVRNDNRRPRPVTLKAQVGPRDHDNPEPAITVMLPDED